MGPREEKNVWIKKEVECSTARCNTWTTISVFKNAALRDQNFTCGFCATRKAAEQDGEINRLKMMVGEKIDALKSHLDLKLNEFKEELLGASREKRKNQDVRPYSSSGLDLVLFGCEETAQEDGDQSLEQLTKSVNDVLAPTGIVLEDSVVNLKRCGRKNANRIRPVLLKAKNVWEARKIIATSQRHGIRLRRDFLQTPEIIQLRKHAFEKNQRLREEAEKERRDVIESYSVRGNKIVKFSKRQDGKWARNDTVPA